MPLAMIACFGVEVIGRKAHCRNVGLRHRCVDDVFHAGSLGRGNRRQVLALTFAAAANGIGRDQQQAIDTRKGRIQRRVGIEIGLAGLDALEAQLLRVARAGDDLAVIAALQQQLDDATAEFAAGAGRRKGSVR